VGEVNFCTNR